MDMSDYKVTNKTKSRYIYAINDNFSKYAWCFPLRDKYCRTKRDDFSKFLRTSKRKPIEIGSDRGYKFFNSVFQNSLTVKNIHHYSRFTDEGRSKAGKNIGTRKNY